MNPDQEMKWVEDGLAIAFGDAIERKEYGSVVETVMRLSAMLHGARRAQPKVSAMKQVLGLISEGVADRQELAERTGRSVAAVGGIIRRARLDGKLQGNVTAKEAKEVKEGSMTQRVINLFRQEGISDRQELAKRAGVPIGSVYSALAMLKKAGAHIPPPPKPGAPSGMGGNLNTPERVKALLETGSFSMKEIRERAQVARTNNPSQIIKNLGAKDVTGLGGQKARWTLVGVKVQGKGKKPVVLRAPRAAKDVAELKERLAALLRKAPLSYAIAGAELGITRSWANRLGIQLGAVKAGGDGKSAFWTLPDAELLNGKAASA